jgi:hypothetical protein
VRPGQRRQAQLGSSGVKQEMIASTLEVHVRQDTALLLSILLVLPRETRRSCVSQQKVCTQKSFLMDNSNLCKIHTMVVDHLLFYCYEHDAYLFLVMRLDTFNTGAFKLNTLV